MRAYICFIFFLVHQQPIWNPVWGLIRCAFALKNFANSPYFRWIKRVCHMYSTQKGVKIPKIGGICENFQSKCAPDETSNGIPNRLLVYQKKVKQINLYVRTGIPLWKFIWVYPFTEVQITPLNWICLKTALWVVDFQASFPWERQRASVFLIFLQIIVYSNFTRKNTTR